MAARKGPRAPRRIRESTFLDDPALYPEFTALTSKFPTLHAFRCGFHSRRTAVMLLLVAVCIALSGVRSPPRGADFADWFHFCFSALAIDRLVAHFEGFRTAFAAMVLVATISVLVYPLHSVMTQGTPTTGASSQPFGTRIITVGLPVVAVWAVALWAKSYYVWGVASGLWFALFCACATLKITSFATVIAPETATLTPNEKHNVDTAGGSRPSSAPAHPLTFREYLFFFFLSPSLVCEVGLLKTSTRRRSRPLRAASEFFHAALGFLAAHCVAGVVIAPSMRLFVAGLWPQWVDGAGPGWTELEAAGGGGWPSWTEGGSLLEGDMGVWVALACFLWILTIVSSCIHFLVFYSFWHCVCLGMAELWGFPDRHLYGCWWLVFDNPRDFLRMWSVPVHRWLSSCVHWPLLEAAAARRSSNNNASASSAAQAHAGNENGDAVAENNGGDGHDKNGANGGEKVIPVSSGWLPAVLATFLVSGVVHEAVVYVAMRGSCWPFNTFLLTVAGLLVITWDTVFPATQEQWLGEASSPSSSVATKAPTKLSGKGGNNGEARGASVAGGIKLARAYGTRGMTSAVVFTALAQLSPFICDVAAWLWWRHIHMKK